MHGITRRQAPISQNNLLGAWDDRLSNRQDLIDHAKQSIECRLNRVAPIDRNITVEDFLQYLRICYQPLTGPNKLFDKPLRIGLMRVGCAD